MTLELQNILLVRHRRLSTVGRWRLFQSLIGLKRGIGGIGILSWLTVYFASQKQISQNNFDLLFPDKNKLKKFSTMVDRFNLLEPNRNPMLPTQTFSLYFTGIEVSITTLLKKQPFLMLVGDSAQKAYKVFPGGRYQSCWG